MGLIGQIGDGVSSRLGEEFVIFASIKSAPSIIKIFTHYDDTYPTEPKLTADEEKVPAQNINV